MTGKNPKAPSPPATRKARPRDLAEVHKPSRKVALNEVLRSLQDLVSNELATPDSGETPETQASPAEAGVESRRKKPVPEKRAAAPSPKPGPEPVRVPPEGLQQEFALDVEATPLAPEPVPQPESGEPSDLEVVPSHELPDAPATPAESVSARDETTDTPPLSELPAVESQPEPVSSTSDAPEILVEVDDLGEIPVLEDIIDFQDDRAGGAVPEASEARRIAIQVAAHLNVELRKAGKTGLNSDVITRLVRLLGEALAKAGANVENNPPEKH